MRAIDFGPDEEFIANYDKLKSSRKMGEIYGCDKSSVLTHARKIGYQVPKRNGTDYGTDESFIDFYKSCYTVKEVADHYGVTPQNLRKHAQKLGLSADDLIKEIDYGADEDFIYTYYTLQSTQLMAEEYGVSTTSILNHAKKIGFDTALATNHPKLSLEDKQYICDQYENMSSTELANHFNVSRGMITKVWFDNNLFGKKSGASAKTTEVDLTNQRFGKWLVLSKSNRRTASGGIYWRCKCDCGIEREVSSLSLRQGASLSCGAHSNISKGNEKIKQLLQQANIPFEIEVKFPTCVDKKELPFDFYVDSKYLIEYDGIQHFQETIFDYEYTHRHDLIKSQWCKENNIALIRIPYTHYENLKLEDLLLDSSKFIEE